MLDRTAETERASTEAQIQTPEVETEQVEAERAEARHVTTQQAASSTESETLDEAAAASPMRSTLRRIRGWLQRVWAFFVTQSFSSLTRRIVFLNVTGLLALSIGVTFLRNSAPV